MKALNHSIIEVKIWSSNGREFRRLSDFLEPVPNSSIRRNPEDTARNKFRYMGIKIDGPTVNAASEPYLLLKQSPKLAQPTYQTISSHTWRSKKKQIQIVS